jgi:hypothetical protein
LLRPSSLQPSLPLPSTSPLSQITPTSPTPLQPDSPQTSVEGASTTFQLLYTHLLRVPDPQHLGVCSISVPQKMWLSSAKKLFTPDLCRNVTDFMRGYNQARPSHTSTLPLSVAPGVGLPLG